MAIQKVLIKIHPFFWGVNLTNKFCSYSKRQYYIQTQRQIGENLSLVGFFWNLFFAASISGEIYCLIIVQERYGIYSQIGLRSEFNGPISRSGFIGLAIVRKLVCDFRHLVNDRSNTKISTRNNQIYQLYHGGTYQWIIWIGFSHERWNGQKNSRDCECRGPCTCNQKSALDAII